MQRTVNIKRKLNHPPAKVWRALTDPDRLAIWFADNDFKPEVGHKFTFHLPPANNFDGMLYCEVMQVYEPELLVYTFTGNSMQSLTTVRWELTPISRGTLLTLTHSGFGGLGDIFVSAIIQFGWWRFLRQLRDVLNNDENITK